MKVFGIDDNSAEFSFLITCVVGVFLFIFTYSLHQKVMLGSKVPPEVSIENNLWGFHY